VVTQDGAVYRYRLTLQKQPGTARIPFRVMVQLPAGAKLLATTPEASLSGDQLVFESALVTDQEFLVEWSE
jgi:hypothetical protein